MNNTPKISIITCSYNSDKTIKDTLKCVANQPYSNVEHIIVDGNSKDTTLNIVNEFSSVAKIISEPDKGIYDAMNKGIRHSTGDIIGILNSDDFYAHSQVLENVVKKLEQTMAATLYADLEYVNKDDTNKVIRVWKSGKYYDERFLYGWMPPHPTFFVRREVYEKYGLFNLELSSAADYELMLRFLFKHKVSTCYLPETIVRMRAGGKSNGSINNRILANNEDRLAWKINNLKPYFFTSFVKPLRKITQFI